MSKEQNHEPGSVTFTKKNYILMGLGVALMALGYILMVGGGSTDPNVFDADAKYSFVRITLSPVLIVLGLLVQLGLHELAGSAHFGHSAGSYRVFARK